MCGICGVAGGEPAEGRELVRESRVQTLELVEKREFLLLFFGMLLDLAALLRHVGGDDLRLRAVREKRASGHGQRRCDRAREPGCEHEARPTGGA